MHIREISDFRFVGREKRQRQAVVALMNHLKIKKKIFIMLRVLNLIAQYARHLTRY
jgi:anionic cell wall polymer biosynthesis LytR-Cps2A-Psr (LCP) family protein